MDRAAARADGRAPLRPRHIERRGRPGLRLAERTGLVEMDPAAIVPAVGGRTVAAGRAEDEEGSVVARRRRGRRGKADRHDEAVQEQ